MSTQRYFAVGINRAKRDPNATTNPDCGFDPSIVPADGAESIDAGEWVVSRSFKTGLDAKIMAALGQRALKGSQDFFVMEHTDGVPTGYYALPRTCTDDQLDDAAVAAIQDMPDRIVKKAMAIRDSEHRASQAHPSVPVQVVFVPRRSSTEQ